MKAENEKLVVLAEFREEPEAGLVKSYLDSKGIESILSDALSNQLFGGAVGLMQIRLSVLEEDLPRARKALEEGGFSDYLI